MGLRVLIVDDSVLYRRVLSSLVCELAGIERVEVAPTGASALEKAERLRPDIITLDLQLPDMSGLEVLQQLTKSRNPAQVVVLSAYTPQGSQAAITAIELGAVDVVQKPLASREVDAVQELRSQLHPIFEGFFLRSGGISLSDRPLPSVETPLPEPHVVAIAASTGGPAALMELFAALPGELRVPILCVVHLPLGFSAHLAASLNRNSSLLIKEAAPLEELQPATVYVAPGSFQMGVARASKSSPVHLTLSDDPPENNCKPSGDYLFRSVAEAYGKNALGLVLTGMGKDGAIGLAQMRKQGARIIAQDPATCVVFGMPREAIRAGVVHDVLSLSRIAETIKKLVG